MFWDSYRASVTGIATVSIILPPESKTSSECRPGAVNAGTGTKPERLPSGPANNGIVFPKNFIDAAAAGVLIFITCPWGTVEGINSIASAKANQITLSAYNFC
jgi:hypothetical protein